MSDRTGYSGFNNDLQDRLYTNYTIIYTIIYYRLYTLRKYLQFHNQPLGVMIGGG